MRLSVISYSLNEYSRSRVEHYSFELNNEEHRSLGIQRTTSQTRLRSSLLSHKERLYQLCVCITSTLCVFSHQSKTAESKLVFYFDLVSPFAYEAFYVIKVLHALSFSI